MPARTCVGLDIGTSTVKVAQIKKLKNEYLLTRVGVANLPMGAIEGGMVRNVDAVAQVITGLLHSLSLKTTTVMPAVAGQTVIVRAVKFPAMSREQLAEAMKWEAERHIPFAINEAVMDFDVVETNPETGEQTVMLVAAQRSLIESHVEVLRKARLEALAMEVQPFVLSRALRTYMEREANGEYKNTAFIDFGAGTTDIVVFKGDVLRFTRIVPIGGLYLTRAIAARLGVSEEEAETIKVTQAQVMLDPAAGGDENATLVSVTNGVANEMVVEIRRSIDYFRLQFHESIAKIVVSGGGTALRNFLPYLERELGMPVVKGDPLASLHPNSRRCAPDLLESNSQLFGVAIGLALRGVQPD